jgi:DNA-binding NarL/FixJ family response regulator
MTNQIKIFLADDHQIMLDGLKSVLKTNQNFDIVGCALNGINLIEDVIKSKADILVMDINMPEKNGLEVLNEVSKTKALFKIIILSSHDDLKLVHEVMKLGVKGYLTKQCAGENIVEAINQVYMGNEYYCDNIRGKIFDSFIQNNQKNSLIKSKNTINLTDRELVVIKLIAQEYSGKEISEKLFISTNTVETHRKNLLKKLNIKSSIGLVKYAIKHNLV